MKYNNELLEKMVKVSLEKKDTALNLENFYNTKKFKKGGGIHIKEKNKGKFTKSAKAAGKSVQEHAHDVMKDPNATTLQKKRANFAIQAKR